MFIDAMGKVCPIPVIMTKKAIKDSNTDETIVVAVDNEIATQNLTKMAEQLGYQAITEKRGDAKYEVSIVRCAECQVISDKRETMTEDYPTGEYVVVLSSNQMGFGDEDFGKKLMEGFIYSLTEQDVLPKKVVCYNLGVDLTAKNAKTIEDLKTLEEKGTEILSCGLCLDYYKIKDNLQVGSITNMYVIAEILRTHMTVRP